MIRIFNRNRNAIGQLMAALIFLGTFGFLFMFDGFATKSQASGCCGGGEAAVTSFAADSSGDFGSGLPMDAESIGGCCGGQDEPIPSSSNNGGYTCGCVGSDGPCSCTMKNNCNGEGSRACPSSNSNCSVDLYVCANYCSGWCEIGGSAPCQGDCDG